jgi:hypothetical protein
MKYLIITATVLASVLFTACKKDTTWVYYDETQCMDKWRSSNVSDNEKIKNVKEYLESKDIQVLNVEILTDGPYVDCDACSCTTGKRIKCEIKESDLEKAINERFYQ